MSLYHSANTDFNLSLKVGIPMPVGVTMPATLETNKHGPASRFLISNQKVGNFGPDFHAIT